MGEVPSTGCLQGDVVGAEKGQGEDALRHERPGEERKELGRQVWMSPPDWLYLPHLGLGGGQRGGGGDDLGRHDGGACKPGHCVDLEHDAGAGRAESNTANAGENLGGQELEAGAIRGRGLPPGCDARVSVSSSAGARTRAGIRGREDEAPGRAAGMTWYFADIAATVAKRRAASGNQVGLSAAERMSALRRRVASRTRGTCDEDPSEAAVAGEATTGQQRLRRQSVGGGHGDEAACASGHRQDLGGGDAEPRCATAQTEAATVAAHHDVAEETERRRRPSGARSSWSARQALLDRLSASTFPPSE